MSASYLAYGYAAVLLMVAAGIQIVRRSAPELRGVRDMTRAVWLDLAAILLIGTYRHVPMAVLSLAGNALFFTGLLFVYRATAEILELKPRFFGLAVGLCAAAIPAFAWFVLVDRDQSVRLMIHCSVVGLLLSFPAMMLFGQPDAELRYARRAAAWAMTLNISLNAVWMAGLSTGHFQLDVQHPAAAVVGFTYAILLLDMGGVVLLAWLALCAHRLDLEQLAHTDSLTGLLNRGAFEQILEREMRRARQAGSSVSVMLIDLDYFKQVNDTLGHYAGDRVLQRVAETLRQGTRPSDRTGRFGGEEFIVLLRNTGLDEARQIAERMRAAIAALEDLPGGIRMTASFGLAASGPEETAENLIVRSDVALYQSKRDGRNLVTVDEQPEDAVGSAV